MFGFGSTSAVAMHVRRRRAILAAIGGLCAFLLRRNVPKRSVATQADAPGTSRGVAVAQVGNA